MTTTKRACTHIMFFTSISLVLTVVMLAVPTASAGTGALRISPAFPMMISSPASFTISSNPSADPTSDPHIFLVMTEPSYDSLMGDVKVEWAGGSTTIPKTDWNKETVNKKKLPPNTTPGAGYTVASLKSHLETSNSIYWAFEPFLNGPITQTPKSFTVTLPSSHPEMLVYALGKDSPSVFDVRVPPTIPGFVVFEPGPALIVLASFCALGAYALRSRARISPKL